MGLFDTFITNNDFTCEACGAVTSMEQGIQSKKFECELMAFKPGDMPFELDENRQVVKDIEWCSKCDETIHIFFAFHRGIYVEAFSSYDLAVHASASFDVLEAYKSVVEERNKIGFKLIGIQTDLTYVHELHSTHPTQMRMSPFFSLRQNNIVDFNIVTTIKNIINKYKSS